MQEIRTVATRQAANADPIAVAGRIRRIGRHPKAKGGARETAL
jgi:hypothetical protein